jgi:hypothetical protein
MAADLETIYDRLFTWCESRGFAGADPFDGLNSGVFAALPVGRFRLARLAWLQTIKRSPVDLRPLLRVPDGVNPKGLALFALAELSRLRATGDTVHAENAGELIEGLLAVAISGRTADGTETVGFGYNFDWQSRVFFAPRGTPAVVPTAFACRALVEGYAAFRDERLLRTAEAVCEFIVTELNRPVESETEVCFSYTPLDKGVVYNASLLAGECLGMVGEMTGNAAYLSLAARCARFVLNRQRPDGAWVYGAGEKQQWVDNFHTAFVLVSLSRISTAIPSMASEIEPALQKGMDYWLDNFFLEDGTPKYYDRATYPIDIHSAAAAIAAMSELGEIDGRLPAMGRKIAQWTTATMLDGEGFFYYQLRRDRTSKTPFMRWGQAWMAYAIARLIEAGAADNV